MTQTTGPLDLRFDGKVAVITGAGSGIGHASAMLLASAGATIVAVDRNQDKLDALMGSLAGKNHLVFPVDLQAGIHRERSDR